MSVFVLAETPAGYGLFKATDKKIFKNESLAAELGRPEKLVEMLKLKKFVKFDSAATALEEAASFRDGKVPTLLASLLDDLKAEKKASLAVADAKLGTAISSLPNLNISPISGSTTMDLFRGIREHISSLIPGLAQENIDRMALGLSHSMSRHKLKFSVEKLDSMIIQAIKLLDDMDKDLNVFAMRTKEWYGWHFPELAKILNDNLAFARLVIAAGFRTNIANTDLSDILPEETEEAVKKAAEISMGTEITEDDLSNIKSLAQQVIRYAEFRSNLSSYLENRMRAVAPNLTALVGYLVGARLIAHTGSLMNLAKAPASTIQILGAEKALFRALKTKHDTPKYGILFHSSLVGQATGKNKGKIARMLAAKAALGLRVDALGNDEDVDDDQKAVMSIANRVKLENHLRRLEGKPLLPRGTNVGPSGDILGPGQFTLKEVRRYNTNADGVAEAVNGDGDKKVKGKKGKHGKVVAQSAEVPDEEMREAEDDASDDEDEQEGASSVNPAKKDKPSEADLARLAELSGLSVKKFKRKYERGDVQLDADGNPKVFSKKEMKKMRKSLDNKTSSQSMMDVDRETPDHSETLALSQTPATMTPAKSKKTVEAASEKKKQVEVKATKKEKKRKHDDDDDDDNDDEGVAEAKTKKDKKRKHDGDDYEGSKKKDKKKKRHSQG
ncbi:nucleolar protein NOP58-like protein [Ophiocordyceps camponoti-floridani]|uniref:Nucleolar protein 58 n=1 Tax=Ophiocordyceps camponoti-floridani TaxID=2030778 RepID=A0A8H4Q4C4_9HYPO|nr:nucleolar protein NOP58-like protein [Ophiocordyceps camponoti-floridani]